MAKTKETGRKGAPTSKTKKVSRRLVKSVADEIKNDVAEDIKDDVAAEIVDDVADEVERRRKAARAAKAKPAPKAKPAFKAADLVEGDACTGGSAVCGSVSYVAPRRVAVKVMLDKGAYMPERAHATDTGYDVRANTVELIHADTPWYRRLFGGEGDVECIVVDTGVHIQPESGFWTMAVPNSRVAKLPWLLGNSVGIIDNGYTGSIKYIYNVLPGVTEEEVREHFFNGAVVGQLIPMPITAMNAEVVTELAPTERGDGGFGSTAGR